MTWKFGTVPSSFIPSFPSSLFLSPSCLAFSNVFLVVCPTAYDLVGIFFVLENHSKQNVIPFFFFFLLPTILVIPRVILKLNQQPNEKNV